MTFDEAMELAYFGTLDRHDGSTWPTREGGRVRDGGALDGALGWFNVTKTLCSRDILGVAEFILSWDEGWGVGTHH